MALHEVKVVQHREIAKYAWSRLALYQNSERTVRRIKSLHDIDPKQVQNAQRQAEQIRHCLSQAKEYCNAADVVSLATKPVLLYYAAMSFALAEILLKQDGNSRLANLRQHHPAHGLALKTSSDPLLQDSLVAAASKLVARAQRDAEGRPMGTFEVWRRSSCEYPIGGQIIQFAPMGTTEKFGILLGADETTEALFPSGGLTLIDCLRELPHLADVLHSLNDRVHLVRAKLERHEGVRVGLPSLKLTVHPNFPDLLDAFGAACQFTPDAVNHVHFSEFAIGYTANFTSTEEFKLSLPPSTCFDTDQVFFSCSRSGLNEFGYLYVALHICGNFARYYPDIWLKHIEHSTALSLAIDELCKVAQERLPLLSLSEMSGAYQIASA